MDCTFEEYMVDVKSQLWCNASSEYRSNYVTFDYTDDVIDLYKDYFEDHWKRNISGYKALNFLYMEFINNHPIEN